MKEHSFQYKYVLYVARKWLVNEQDAEDFSQDFYVWYSEHLKEYDHTRSTFKKWFNANLVFKLHNFKHKNRLRGVSVNHEEVQLIDNSAVELLDQAIERGMILKASRCLTTRQQEYIRLYLDGHDTAKDVADQLGLSRMAINMGFRLIKPRLKKALLREGV